MATGRLKRRATEPNGGTAERGMGIIRIIHSSDTREVDALLSPWRTDDRAVMRRVRRIVDAVRAEGDAGVRRYAARFDGFDGPFEIPRAAWKADARKAPRDVRDALKVAAANIATVAEAQRPQSRRVRVAPGITVEQRVRPLDRVGCYVPGGRYPLPSTLLMTAIPARVAGVPEIVAVCPRPEPIVLAAAEAAGVTRLFRLGRPPANPPLPFGQQRLPRGARA